MSKRLHRAAAEGRIVVTNKTTAEIKVVFYDEQKKRQEVLIHPAGTYRATVEIAPKMTSAELAVKYGNLRALISKGMLKVE
jgi:hypothetical protein